MTALWTLFVALLVLVTAGTCFFLLCWAPWVKVPQEGGTTTHAWAHGVIREGVQDLPRWWLAISFGAFACFAILLALFPGVGGFGGLLGWSSTAEHERAQEAEARRLSPLLARVRQGSLGELAADPEIVRTGRRLFADNCAACHGEGARGIRAIGAPDLIDGDWLYGGDDEALMTSILDGRNGVMPPQAEAVGTANVTNLANYVASLSGRGFDPLKAELGRASFAVCAACHGPQGKGNPLLGAPNLTDSIWLHGGTVTDIEHAITQGRSGVMPAWRERLGEDNARMVAAWLRATARSAGSTP